MVNVLGAICFRVRVFVSWKEHASFGPMGVAMGEMYHIICGDIIEYTDHFRGVY